MNSILKIFNASANSQVKMIGLFCILLTACGGEDITNPRAIDKNPPQISINTNADKDNFINIGRYDSQHPLLSEYAGHELIIQTDNNLIVYDDDGLDDKGNPIDGSVIGFRKQASVDGELEVAVIHQIKTAYTDAGATARDALDLDNLVIQNEATQSKVKTSGLNELITNTKETYEITYTAEDASGNIGHAHRKVIVGDYVTPVVTLIGGNSITIEANSNFVDPSANAYDVADDASIDVVTTLILCGEFKNGECLSPESVSSVDTGSSGTYIATYSATDTTGNVGTATRPITVLGDFNNEVVVLRNGLLGEDWDKGIFGFDEAENWAAFDDPSLAPSINWEMVDDTERGYQVLQISHEVTDKGSGLFIESSDGVNLLGAEDGGIIQFDVKVISGDPRITFKSGCVYPCGGGPQDIGAQPIGEWTTIRWPVSQLIPGDPNEGSIGHDLSKVTTGIELWATGRSGTVFQVDNISWQCIGECSKEKFDPQPYFTLWDKTVVTNGYVAPTTYEGFDLVWNDEFNTGEIDPAKWTHEFGNGGPNLVGWGNSELQHYTPQNATVDDELLTIEAKYHHEPLTELDGNDVPGGATYTSSKITTEGKFTFQYGRVDIRAAVAEGQGLWSAGWMLGATGKGWPYSGEIDIFDTVGGTLYGIDQETMIVHNMYWNNGGPDDEDGEYEKVNINEGDGAGEVFMNKKPIPEYQPNDTFSNKFHVYSIVWTEENIKFYVNNYETLDVPMAGVMGETFQQGPFYLILNVAVGGTWPQPPQLKDPDADDFTHFPRGMLVDYVRVYQPTSND